MQNQLYQSKYRVNFSKISLHRIIYFSYHHYLQSNGNALTVGPESSPDKKKQTFSLKELEILHERT